MYVVGCVFKIWLTIAVDSVETSLNLIEHAELRDGDYMPGIFFDIFLGKHSRKTIFPTFKNVCTYFKNCMYVTISKRT